MYMSGMRPVHPGEILREDFLVPLGMSANALAKALKVQAPRINGIVRERRLDVSADTAMRLARYFGGDGRSWLNLQTVYDLRVAEIQNIERIEREIIPAALDSIITCRSGFDRSTNLPAQFASSLRPTSQPPLPSLSPPPYPPPAPP
ncbi:MAG: HigA family addiction module antidote protein [Desulfobulbaceae bacterium]|nr:HigA family addiction module antidote protein [Desulfobulbaceae bacterium]